MWLLTKCQGQLCNREKDQKRIITILMLSSNGIFNGQHSAVVVISSRMSSQCRIKFLRLWGNKHQSPDSPGSANVLQRGLISVIINNHWTSERNISPIWTKLTTVWAVSKLVSRPLGKCREQSDLSAWEGEINNWITAWPSSLYSYCLGYMKRGIKSGSRLNVWIINLDRRMIMCSSTCCAGTKPLCDVNSNDDRANAEHDISFLAHMTDSSSYSGCFRWILVCLAVKKKKKRRLCEGRITHFSSVLKGNCADFTHQSAFTGLGGELILPRELHKVSYITSSEVTWVSSLVWRLQVWKSNNPYLRERLKAT